MEEMINEIKEYLPLLVPAIIAQFGLLAYVLHHILTHTNYKIGNRKIWLIVCILAMNFVGPITYLVLGKEEE